MKKTAILFLLLIMSFSVTAYDLEGVEDGFESFADEVAGTLPLMAGMGLNWNDAYTGIFPRFGVGLTMGAVFIPSTAFEDISDLIGDDTLTDLSSLGVPLPMYSLDARVGIPILPMDAGFKIGVLDTRDLMDIDYSLNYLMLGGDVRYAVLKGNPVLPELSVGVGYTYLKGEVVVPVGDQEVDISDVSNGVIGNELAIEDTDMIFDWGVNIFDFKAQVSKKLLLLNLSAGMGYSYGVSTAGGGITNGTVSLDGNEISATDIAALEAATGIEIDDEGVIISSDVNGGALRLFGGAGLNLPLFKIDFGLNYGITNQTLGMTTNLRIQL